MVRVGITGHRWNKLKPERKPELVAELRSVLERIADIAGHIRDDRKSGYRPLVNLPGEEEAPGPELRLVSALAEGADRLLVEAAPPGWRLQAILPFPVDIYRRDFTEPGSTDELMQLLGRAGKEAGVLVLDGNRDAENAFEAVGTAICLNSDVLIGIWDRAEGKPGGTGYVVRLAGRLGIPIVLLDPDAVKPPVLEPPGDSAKEPLAELSPRLARLCAAPPEKEEPREEGEVPDLREEYFSESWHAGRRGQLYSAVIRLVSYQWKGWRQLLRDLRHPNLPYLRPLPKDYPASIRSRWRRRWQEKLGLSAGFVDPILATPLADHYGWASSLANYYAGRYRGAFLWGYLLSVLAVFAAAAGLTAGLVRSVEKGVWYGAMELFLLCTIFIVVRRARRGDFHERWLAYRSLTERLRSLTYTLPLARASTLRADTGPELTRSDSWVDWMHRAVIREVGLLPAAMTPEHLQEAQRLLIDGELSEQVAYHRENAARLSRVEARLSVITTVVFILAILLAGYHLVEGLRELKQHGEFSLLDTPKLDREGRIAWTLGIWIGIVGLTAPAFAAAVHGFLSQAEFKETAQRSLETEKHLQHLIKLGREPDAARNSTALGGLAAASAAAMDAELGAWFAAYQGKDVPLP